MIDLLYLAQAEYSPEGGEDFFVVGLIVGLLSLIALSLLFVLIIRWILGTDKMVATLHSIHMHLEQIQEKVEKIQTHLQQIAKKNNK